MKAILLSLAVSLIALLSMIASPAMAQVDRVPEADPPEADQPELSPLPPLVLDPTPLIPPQLPPPAPLPNEEPEAEDESDASSDIITEAPTPDVEAPDYSRLSSNEERQARLDDIFERLAEAETEEAGNLVAEEIWALWLDSGSPSVNLILRRGASAQTRGNVKLARRMFDHVTLLEPDFAEGWARSSRLALEEGDFTRAVGEAIRALSLEPRHFYALWTLGNVLERMGRNEEALDAYREANSLFPAQISVSNRIDALELRLGGAVL